MLKYLFLILLSLVLMLAARSQAVHYFSCVEVVDGGDVWLSWEPAGNSNDFIAYDIYHTTTSNPGSFQLIHSEDLYNVTEFTHNATTAHQQENIYFVLTRQNGLPDIISDTLSTIHLTVDNSTSFMAVLDWNAMHVPLLAASENYYKVYSHNPLTTFGLVDSTVDLSMDVPVNTCWDTLFFKVEIADENGCISVSNIVWKEFRDYLTPPIPSIDSVSIDPFTGEAIIGWPESNAGDAGGYVVYHVMPSKNDTLDFIFGNENTSYIDNSFDPCTENRAYALSAFDTCINISPGSYDLHQRTILFNEVIFNPCEMSNSLSWTEYINMNPVLEGYRVYLSTDGNPFQVLTTLAATTTEYLHNGLSAGHTYQYFIRAFSIGNQVSSTSCFRDITTWQYKQPLENEIHNASVVDDALVSIILRPDTYAFVPMMNLYRAEAAGGTFELLAEIDLNGEEEVYYDDLSADVDDRSYYYRSSIIDSCGNEVLPTEPLRTILLQGEQADEQTNLLYWNAFEGWPSGVEAYEIYRSIDDRYNFVLISSTSSSDLGFVDDLSQVSQDYSRVYYVVGAADARNNGQTSWSNEILVEYEPQLFLPNAFTPQGANPVYKPEGAFAQFSEYSMDIYNRWGQLLFSTFDFDTGWDGTYQGGNAPAGVYICVITYRSNSGSSNTLKSTLVLIR